VCFSLDRDNSSTNATEGVCGLVAAQETFIVNSEQARQQAEKRFKQDERVRDGRKAMAEYEAEARAVRENTARLKALRLAKEAIENKAAPTAPRRTVK
jgi:hypothetical protein